MDSSAGGALDFEAELHGYSTALRGGGGGVVGCGASGGTTMGGGRSEGRSSGIKALTVLCIDVQVESIRKRSTPAYHLLLVLVLVFSRSSSSSSSFCLIVL